MYFIELGFGHNIQAQYKIRCHCSQCEKVWQKPLETLRSLALEKTSVWFGGWNITVPVLRYRNNTGIILSESYILHKYCWKLNPDPPGLEVIVLPTLAHLQANVFRSTTFNARSRVLDKVNLDYLFEIFQVDRRVSANDLHVLAENKELSIRTNSNQVKNLIL